MEKKYRNLGYVLLLMIPICLLGFSTTYIKDFPFNENNPGAYIHFHFIVVGVWIILLIIQPFLIRNRKNTLHRNLGKFSYLLFPLVVISMLPLFLGQVRAGYVPLIALTGVDIVSVMMFYVLAIYYRRDVTRHMRYMIALSLLFILPAMGRILGRIMGYGFIINMHLEFVFVVLILLALLFRDGFERNKSVPYYITLGIFGARQSVIYFFYYLV